MILYDNKDFIQRSYGPSAVRQRDKRIRSNIPEHPDLTVFHHLQLFLDSFLGANGKLHRVHVPQTTHLFNMIRVHRISVRWIGTYAASCPVRRRTRLSCHV
ncbi:hypothetical protein D3C87_1829300 [compost metagenome]